MSIRRIFAALIASSLAASSLGLAVATPAAAVASINLDKKAPASVLLGDAIPYELTASNPTGSDPLYNVGFSDVLPAGFEYVGPTSPSSAGEPKISTTSGGQTLLVWSNVTDLQVNSSFTLSFTAQPVAPLPETIVPVDTNSATVAGQTNERLVPKFDAEGQPISATGLTQKSDTTNTARDPFVVEKENTNSPEGELLRGVHKNRSVYTLTVRNNKVKVTKDITVTDYIPAGMEFLGCGNQDNGARKTEYTESGPLGSPALNPNPCPAPTKVETVKDPAGLPTGVYTAVTWAVPDLDPDKDYEIKYVAGIPMQPNTMVWNGPTPDTNGPQGSNLDNNNGPPPPTTREGTPEQSLTNKVFATGTFTGTPTGPRTVTTQHSVKIEDLRMRKRASQETFVPGGIVTFTFTLDTSEYVSAEDVVITDLLPDGYCPLGAVNYDPGNALCEPIANQPSQPYASVTRLPANDWSVVFAPVSVNGTLEVSFPARMLPNYGNGAPTLAGDSFRNSVSLQGTTTSIPQVAPIETGDATVGDDSSATQTTSQPTIQKLMKPRPANPADQGMDCRPDVGDDYGDSATFTEAQASFRKGDLLCFKLRVDFPNISTGGVTVTDFLDEGTAFVDNSVTKTTANNVTFTAASDNPLKWTLTSPPATNSVAPGAVFEVYFAARVLQPATTDKPDLTGNLMKMRSVNTAGEAQSYRDQQDFTLLPPPNLSIKKGVKQTFAPAVTFNPPADNKPVQQGSKVTFQVDVKNLPRPATPIADYSARKIEVWDVLPSGITCAAPIDNFLAIKPDGSVESLTSGVTCVDPPVNGQNKLSYIKWTLPDTDAFAVEPDETLSLLYDMKIPDPSSVSTRFDNTAYVRSFAAFTDETGKLATYYPANNIDTTVIKELWDAPEMKDPSDVFLRGVGVTKTGTPSPARIGETITYTYTATIPNGSTVFNAVLSDTNPPAPGVELRSIVGADLDGGALPGSFPAFDTNITNNPTGRLVFPDTYSNNSGADQKFRVTVTAQVTKAAVPCTGETVLNDVCVTPPSPSTNVSKRNTASFNSNLSLGGTPVPVIEGRKTIDIVQPNPSIIKTVEPEQMTSADQELLVTLQVANPGGTRPPLHDWVAKDCLPSPFIFVPGSATVPTGITQSLDANGCVLFTGSTTSPPTPPTDPITGGAFYRVSFKIKSTTSLPASQVYENTATLDSSSMAGDVPGERDYFTSSKATFTSPGLIIRDKTTNPDKAPVGSRFTSTIRFSLIGGVNYYSAAVIDTLPAGMDPGSVQQISFTCAYAVSQLPCDPAITPTVLTPDGQKIGWSAGDVLGAGQGDRVVTIVYSAVAGVVDGNVAGTTLTNSAKPFWSGTVLQNPPTTIAGFEALPATTPPVTDTVTLTEPALSIVKKVDGQDTISATPGQTFTYTLEVTNASGPNVSAANDVTITDDIPAGIEVVGSPSDGGQVSSSTITWTINSLAAGAEKTVSFEARLKAPATGEQTNTATVAEYYSLANMGGRKYTGPSDTAELTPVLPVLTIAKDASAALAYINDPYTWTIVVTNTSGATAYGVDVEDTLPPNWTYKANSAQWVVTGGTPAGKEPTGTAPDIAWNDITDLPSGKTLTITFQATPGPGVVQSPGVGLGTKHTNSALTSWTLGPAGQSWSTATSTPDTAQTEIASADLALTKIHDNQNPAVGKDEVVPGTEFLWILKATNKGPDASMGVFTVEDTLPSGTEFRGYQDGTGWSCNAVGQKVTCTNPGPVNGLAKDASLSDLVLIVYVDPAFTGDMKNTATVNGRTYDPDPDNNKAEDTVTARPLADVAITKTSTKPYVVGGQVTYTLTVTNNGPSVSVAPITVEDTLPTGLSIASIDDGAWDCTPKTGETSNITCTLDKDLARDEQADLIKVTVDVLESPGDAALNKATVTPTTEDPNLGNNTATVEDPVISDVQLGIEKKTTGANPVVAGRSTEFTITVTNAGPAKAKNVQVVDQLEAGLRATSANGPGWTCDLGSGTVVTCTRANFPLSASPSDIVITADVDKAVPGGTTLKNTATVTTTSPQEGGNPPPAVSTVDVIADSDLAITKTHDGGPWTIGKQGTWRVQVTNNGPSDNPGPIKVVDSLPVGTAFVSATGDGWTCTGADRSLTCELASGLQVGQSSGFSVLVDVVNGAHPRVINTVDVSSPITDSNPANNRATDPVDVDRAKQTADRLPPNPSVLPARKTEQGQKIRTTVRCRPLKTSTAGEASYCRVKRSKNGTVRVKVFGSLPVRVIVTQFAKGTDDYKPFQRVKKYIVRP